MDEDLLALIIVHCILLTLLLLFRWQAKRKKRDTSFFALLVGLYTVIIFFTILGFLNVFGQLVATDGFEIGMYSFFGGCLLIVIGILSFIIQVIKKKKSS